MYRRLAPGRALGFRCWFLGWVGVVMPVKLACRRRKPRYGGADPKDNPHLAKFSLRVSCPAEEERNGQIVVLRNRKLYLDDSDLSYRTFDDRHPFAEFYLDYPACEKPLNWIYADGDTLELKYGNKSADMYHDHIHGLC
ncbi:hypothetical protein FB451DRAFT_1270594 [Mycena latifolia]|nr:hypothetical protein FB451DRAFT_1270594 [Mycena latifolia]